MAQRAFSLRYAALKLAQAVEEMAAQLPSGLPIAVARGMEAYQRQLTSVIFLAGTAMSPTFNGPRRGEAAAGGAAAAGQQDEQVERLLLRLIPRPSPKSVFVDDVVAFTRWGDTRTFRQQLRRRAARRSRAVHCGSGGSGGRECTAAAPRPTQQLVEHGSCMHTSGR